MTESVECRDTGSQQEVRSAQHLFDSTSDIGSIKDWVPTETEEAKLQKKNMAVIKGILEKFNLEDTKKKYETQNVVEYVLDPNDFGYDCSLSTTRVRQRLCDLMGTDVIRLNDKRYFQKLTQRLQEEYETAMDKQEEARAASEEERLRRLMLEGVIDAPNDYRAVVQGPGKQSKKKKKRKIKRHASSYVPDPSEVSDDEGQSKSRKEDVVTQLELLSSARQTPPKSPEIDTDDRNVKSPENRKERRVTIEEKENNSTSQTLNETHARPPHHENALRTSSACSSHRSTRRIQSAAPRLKHWDKERPSSDDDRETDDTDFDTQSLPERHYVRKPSKYSRQEPERISKLREAETVAGLYSIAEELVAPLGSSDQPIRKVPIKKPKTKITVAYS